MKKITGTLINPAISVMNRLRFGQKIALIGVLFCLPIAALFHTLVTKIETDLAFTRAEITGLQSVTLIGHLAQNLQKHRGLSQKIIGGETAAESKLAETAANIDQLFGQLDNFDKLYGATYKTQSTWQDIKSRWAKLRSAGHSVGASQSFNDHSELVSRLAAYLTGIADGSNLSLDPDLDTYYLMDAVVFRLPNLAESVAKMRGLGAGVAARDAATPDERIAFAVLGKLAELDFGNLQGSLEKVFAFNPDSKSRLSAKAKLARDTIGEFTSAVESKIIKAEKIAFDGDKYFKQGNDAVDSAFALFDAAATDLGRLLAARVTKMESDRTQTLLSLGAVLAAVLYLYVGFLLSVKRSLATIVTGVGRLAKGDLTSKIDLHTRDELREVADSVDKVASTLNLFASAQIEMADQHQAGKISHKLPADNFAGAFKEIADKTNDLVGSQIAVTMRVVEVVSSYSKGDLSTDMDRLPGEKARITGVVDDVKASLLAINSQIGTLVDAAASGDFKVRGDTGKYQHEFRKMISRLNELMEVSDTGLAEVSRVLAALAKGDLTETISNQYSGTFGQLKDDSNITVARLTEIIGQLRHAAESINTAAKEIASGNADLSSRTEEQASSLEETASSMEELASAVRQNAENARAANQLAISANEIAVSGGETVGKAIAAMVSISESSKRIENIINVIDGIAFQTNILALNAAVEAARAGEQGRGFAVVASEVRNLAHKSAEAAREIKGLIGDSAQKVDAGTAHVNDAGKTMTEIVQSVKRVMDIMGEISAASQEQSAGIEQVNTAITQMDEVTQQNAALVEQAAAAAESLEEQAEVLAKAVGVFNLSGSSDAKAPVKGERRDVTTRPANVARLPAQARKPLNAGAPRGKVSGSNEEWNEF